MTKDYAMTQEITGKKNITERLENGKILPLIIKLSVPAVIAQLITFLYNIVDRMYVARIKDAGAITATVIFITFPKVFKKRAGEVKTQNRDIKIKTE